MHKGLYISNLSIHDNRVNIALHHPVMGPTVAEYKFSICEKRGGSVVDQYSGNIPASWGTASIGPLEIDPEAIWELELEDCLAFNGPIPTGTTIVS